MLASTLNHPMYASPPSASDLLVLLKDHPLFAGLPESTVVAALAKAELLTFRPEENVVRYGEYSDALFLWFDGLAAVTPRDAWIPGATALGWITPGEILGEVGVLTSRPRTATVTCITRARAIRIDADRFVELMHLHPRIGVGVSRLLASRMATSMFVRRAVHKRGALIVVVACEPAQAMGRARAIASLASGVTVTVDATPMPAGASEQARGRRMIHTARTLDHLTATHDYVIVAVPSGIDAAYAQPLMERAQVVVLDRGDAHPEVGRQLLKRLSGARVPVVPLAVDADPKSVLDRLGLPHEVEVLMPTTIDIDRPIDPTPHVDAIKSLFCKCFGGATVRRAEGVWMSAELGQVDEPILVVSAACGPETLDANIETVTSHLQTLKATLRQEAIAMRLDGRLILL